jgi:hypothetical protein
MTYFLLSLRDPEGGRLSDSIAIAADPNGYYGLSVDAVDCNAAGTAATVVLESPSPGLPEHLERIEKDGCLSLAIAAVLSGIQSLDAEAFDFDLAAHLRDDAPIPQEEWVAGFDGVWTTGHRNLVPGSDTITDPRVSGSLLPRGGDAVTVKGITWGEISNLGFVNGRLHLQIRRTQEFFGANCGDPALVDRDGTALYPYYNITAGDYTEYFFGLVGEESLKNYTLAFSGARAAHTVTGNWNLRFDAPPPPETRELTVPVGELIYARPAVEPRDYVVNQIRFSVAPMSAKIYLSFAPGKAPGHGLEYAGSYLTLTDGREIPLTHRGDSEDQQNPENSYGFYIHEYIDPADVSSVTFWGAAYPFGG